MNEEIKLKERATALDAPLEQVEKIVPTLFLIGTCSDGVGAFYVASPKEDSSERESDVGMSIYAAMRKSEQIRDILLSAVGFFLTRDHERWKKLKNKMDEFFAKKAGLN